MKTLRLLVALIATGLLPLSAETYTWINTAGGLWSAPGNWLPSGVPGPEDTALINESGEYTVTINTPVSVGELQVGESDGEARVTLEIANALTLNNGNVRPNATISLTGTMTVNGAFSVLGRFVWSSGLLVGAGTTTVQAGAEMRITGGSDHNLPGHTLANRGSVTWDGGRIRGDVNSHIVNSADWNVDGGSDINSEYGGGPFEVTNDGRWTVRSGGNRWLVRVGGSGRFESLAGAGLYLDSGGLWGNGARLVAGGDLHLRGGAFEFAGGIQSEGAIQTGGVLAGDFTLNGVFTWQAGNWNNAGATIIPTNATLVISTGNDHDMAGHTITNRGTVNWTGGRIRGNVNSLIVNESEWNADGGGDINSEYGGGPFDIINNGLWKAKSGGNRWLVRVGGNGRFESLPGAGLYFDVGGTWGDGARLVGGGDLHLRGGGFAFAGGVRLEQTVIHTGGTFVGDFTWTGTLTWLAGNWNSPGTTIIPTNATLVIATGNDHDMAGHVLTNRGTVNWTGGRIRGNVNTLIVNEAEWNADGGGDINSDYGGGPYDIVNNGRWTVKSGANRWLIRVGGNGRFESLAGAGLYFDVGGTFGNGAQLIAAEGSDVHLRGGGFGFGGPIQSQNVIHTGGVLLGDFTLNGTFFWQGGNWNGEGTATIPAGSTLRMITGNDHDLAGRTLVNAGRVIRENGRVRGNVNTLIRNEGEWTDLTAAQFNTDYGGGPFSFRNSGVYHRTGEGAVSHSFRWEDTGRTIVENGYMGFGGSGDYDGEIEVAADAAVDFFGTHVFHPGHVLRGAGPIRFTGGGITLDAPVTSTNITLQGAVLYGNRAITGFFRWVSGQLNVGSTTVAAGGSMLIESGNDHDMPGHSFTNLGSVVWTGGRIRGGGGTAIWNNNDWQVNGGSMVNGDFGGSIVLQNVGLWSTMSGSVALAVPVVGIGEFRAAADSETRFLTGTTLQDGVRFTGSGLNRLQGGGISAAGTIHTANLFQEGPILRGDVTFDGKYEWIAGNWNDGGTYTVSAGSTLVIGSGNDHDMAGSTIRNFGTVRHDGGRIRHGGGSRIENSGTWLSGFDATQNNDYAGTLGLFLNTGAYRKTDGGGDAGFGIFFRNEGSIEALSGGINFAGGIEFIGGSLRIAAGNLSVPGTFNIQSGSVAVNGRIYSKVVNSGTLSPGASPGGVLVWESYTQTEAGTLDIELGGEEAGTGYDQLAVNGLATLAGRVQIRLVNGFIPPTNSVYDIVTPGGRVGEFGQFAYPANQFSAALDYQDRGVRLNINDVFVTDTNTLPDLVVRSIGATPSPAVSGRRVTINWQETNGGGGPATNATSSRVTIRNATGSLLAEGVLANPASQIPRGGFAQRSLALTLPDGPIASGTLTISVTADVFGEIGEQNRFGTGEQNNDGTGTVESVIAPYPDLQVVALASPPAWIPGQPVAVSWRTTNSGARATAGGWAERVVVQNLNSGTVLDTTTNYVESTEGAGPIEVGGFRPRGLSFTPPVNSAGYGRFRISATTDSTNAVFEYVDGFNAETNNTASIEIVSAADLVVSNVVLSAAGGLRAGGEAVVSWRTYNVGNVPALLSFWETVQIRNVDRDLAIAQDQPLYDASTNPIPFGSFRERSLRIRIPDGVNGAGLLRAVVTADSSGVYYEAQDGGESNNSGSGDAPSVLPAYPDLRVAGVSIGGTPLITGGTALIRWAVTNTGTAPTTGAWVDTIQVRRVSNGETVVNLGTPLTPEGTVLAPGQSLARELAWTIPDAPYYTGEFDFVVKADGGLYVFEYSPSEDAEQNNTGSARATITLAPQPNLTVTGVSGPATARPGSTVTVRYTVRNPGAAATSAAFRETLWLSPDGTATGEILGVFDATGGLGVGAVAERTRVVEIPDRGGAGNLRFVAVVDTANAVAESDETDNAAASTPVSVPQELRFALNSSSVPENYAGTLQGTVSRNGDTAAALSVTVSYTPTNVISGPVVVEIPAGSRVATIPLTPRPDGMVTGPRSVTVAVSAASFRPADSVLTVTDVDVPRLTLALGRTNLVEGGGMEVRVSRDGLTNLALMVNLSASDPNLLDVPASVIIPAGSTNAIFVVASVDNRVPESSRLASITASSAGYIPAVAGVGIEDNDRPVLTLTLARNTASEGDGPLAVSATISRATVEPVALTVRLTSSRPGDARVPATVIIPAGVARTSFNIGTVDNQTVDGVRDVTITATVTTGAGDILAAAPPVNLTVTDDDGPTIGLQLARNLVREGETNVLGLVQRNTATNVPLVISLSVSPAGFASLPATVTIPAGARSATFPFGVPSDGVTAGNRSAIITARSAGFVDGNASLVITDGDLPDLVIGGILAPTNAITGETVSIGLRIENRGFSTARGRSLQQVFVVRDPAPTGDPAVTAEFSGEIPAGSSVSQTLVIQAPSEPGDYWIVATADADRRISELLDENNTAVSAARLHVNRAYGATVAADVDSAPAGTPVTLRGTATLTRGGPAALQLVSVHVTTRGTRRVISARTDAEGRFVTEFTPLPYEAGRYGVAADHPGVAEPAEQDSFVLLGMTAEQAPLLVIDEGASGQTEFVIQNLAPLPLTGLQVSVAEPVAGITVTPSLPSATLSADGSLRGRFTASVPIGTLRGGVGRLLVTSAEGPSVRVPFGIRVEVRRPILVATPTAIEAGAARGRRTTLSFAVTNIGALSTGPLRVLLPDLPWLTTTVSGEMPPIAPGEGRIVTLLATPAQDQPLGQFDGNVAVSDGNVGVNVGLKLRVLSEQRGDLLLTATDEYTFYAEGAPHVTNALVTVRDPLTFELVAHGSTGPDGRILFTNLLEADYVIDASADGHNPYHATITVGAGRTNEVEAFLSRELVRYTWTVNPTQIEDRTRITIETTFETVVPVPVVTMEPPLIDLTGFEGSVTQINLTLRNQGLIAADNTRLAFEDHPGWIFRTLVTNVGRLPALSSITVPLIIERRAVAGAGELAKSQPAGPCSAGGATFWDLWCGNKINTYTAPTQITGLSDACNGPVSSGRLAEQILNLFRGFPVPAYPGDTGDTGGGPGFGPGGGGIFLPHSPTQPSVLCDPCFRARAAAVVQCVVDFIPLGPLIDCGKDFKDCVVNSAGIIIDNQTGALPAANITLDCSKAIVSCLDLAGREVPVVGQVINVVKCGINLVTACDDIPAGPSSFDPLERFDLRKSASTRDLGDIPMHLWRLSAWVAPITNIFGNEAWFAGPDGAPFNDWYAAFNNASKTNSPEGRLISTAERTTLLGLTLPPEIDATEAGRFLDRWNRTVAYWTSGIYSAPQVPVGQSRDFIDLNLHYALTTNSIAAEQAAQLEGRPNLAENLRVAMADYRNLLDTDSGSGTCARIRLRLTQEAVVTRDAFQATLELDNDTAGPLEDISVEIAVRNALGADTTSLFVIRPPTLENLGAINGTGSLAAHTTGSAGWLIIPSHDAAPTAPVEHFVSGTLRYRQNGVLISIPLAPARINVMPNAQLTLKYFHERDVYSDDPFTPQIEPAIPYNLAVMVKNSGYGAARNLRITSAQPEIIENERGLAIDFRIIGSEVAGQPQSPSLEVSFGDVAPGQIKVARWLLTSTLQGLFTDYSATFENLSGLGDRRVAIIQDVEIHEMNRLVEADGVFADGQPDFLVNDQPDVRDRPDTLHLSTGEVLPVRVSTNATVNVAPTAGSPSAQITAVMSNGWTYLRIADPSAGSRPLLRVRRGDGSLLPSRNAWTTDRTFIGLSHRPIMEAIFHLLDYQSDGRYTLEYGPAPVVDTTAPSSRVAALTESSPAEFSVRWDGTDNDEGSGVAGFDIYVSENGAPFAPWLLNTADIGALYRGVDGRRYAFYSVARDRAGNIELPPPQPDASTLVSATNHVPVVPLPSVVIADEGTTITATIAATDPDSGQRLAFAIGAGGTPAMRINSVSGLFAWPTTESDGPSTNLVQIVVTDDGQPPRSVSVPLTIIVREVNVAPAVDPIADLAVNELTPISFGVTARDSDLPAQTLTYRLGAGAPAGATISAAGLFTWRPDRSQGPSTNEIAVQVSDNGSPVLTTTRRFTVVVRDSAADFVVRLGSTRVNAGQTASIPVSLETVEALLGLTLDIDLMPAGPIGSGVGFNVSSAAIAGATVQPLAGGGIRLQIDARVGLPMSGSEVLGNLTLPTVSDAPSAVILLLPRQPLGHLAAGIDLTDGEARPGRLIYVSGAPVLTIDRENAGNILRVHNHLGRRYRVERSTAIRGPVWSQLRQTDPADDTTETAVPESAAAEFFRAVEVP